MLSAFGIKQVPELAPRLRRTGLVRWVERLSNSVQTRQDIQAGLLVSKQGRIKAKHVSKAAGEFLVALAKLPPPSPEDMCPVTPISYANT